MNDIETEQHLDSSMQSLSSSMYIARIDFSTKLTPLGSWYNIRG